MPMCEFNWILALEYIKVFLGWPPIALGISILFFWKFRKSIEGLIERVVEGNLLGQTFKATPHAEQQRDAGGAESNKLLPSSRIDGPQHQATEENDPLELPPELRNDPYAKSAISYVKENPIKTVIEYKKLLFQYNAERLFNSIFGTQISVLEYLASRQNIGASLDDLSPFHKRHQELIGRDEYPLRDYLGFLVGFGAITATSSPDGEHFYITPDGVEFLNHIKAIYPTSWHQRPL